MLQRCVSTTQAGDMYNNGMTQTYNTRSSCAFTLHGVDDAWAQTRRTSVHSMVSDGVHRECTFARIRLHHVQPIQCPSAVTYSQLDFHNSVPPDSNNHACSRVIAHVNVLGTLGGHSPVTTNNLYEPTVRLLGITASHFNHGSTIRSLVTATAMRVHASSHTNSL